MAKWTEVNIVPASAKQPERLLTGVVDPLVHDVLNGRWDRWHFFWEPELRLRFHWGTPDGSRNLLATHLDQAASRGLLTSWTEVPYDGEASEYGPEVWNLVTADWMSGSELALAIIKAGKNLTRHRAYHWTRRQHLFANELSVPEVAACLWEADGRLGMYWPEGAPPEAQDVRTAIGRYFADDMMWAGEASSHRRALEQLLADSPTALSPPAPTTRQTRSSPERHR